MTQETNRWIMLAYDGSPSACAAIRRAAVIVRQRQSPYTGLLVVTAGVDPDVLDAVLDDTRAIAGADIPIEVHLLRPDDPEAGIGQLAAEYPDASLAAPVFAEGCAPWYAAACRYPSADNAKILFFLTAKERTAALNQRALPRRTVGQDRVRALRRVVASLFRRPVLALDKESDASWVQPVQPSADPPTYEPRRTAAPAPQHQDVRR